MTDPSVRCLRDLARLRAAPALDDAVARDLRRELQQEMALCDWFTVGVMAPSTELALGALRTLEADRQWQAMPVVQSADGPGPVFLKGNQRSDSVRIRIEHGLGEGILITGHRDDPDATATTWGPLPLNFF